MNNKMHNFKKKYGQNFLQDKSLINKIVSSVHLNEDDLVIEIGPGSGAMTKELVKKCQVVAYEIDNDLKDVLLSNVNCNKLMVIWDDFLKRNIKKDISLLKYKKLYIIANLPYYITTPIILKIINEKLPISQILIMVQEEVADRFSSCPGNKEYGSITVFLNYYFEIKKVLRVSRNVFFPRPNVDSAVISLTPKKSNEIIDEDNFFCFVRDCFKFKRKTLRNNLKGYDLEKIDTILKKYGYDLSCRAEQLPLKVFLDIFMEL